LQNPLLPGVIFETTLLMELDTSKVVGDSLRWKFVASPSDRWSNSGYENGMGHYTVFQPNGSTVEIVHLNRSRSKLYTKKRFKSSFPDRHES
jgi:hypothetical protein